MINVKITDVKILNLRVTEKIGAIEPAWSPGQLSSFEKDSKFCKRHSA